MDKRRFFWEIGICISVFLIGLYGLLESLKMPKGTPHDSPGLTPAFLSAVLMLLSLSLILYLLIKRVRVSVFQVKEYTSEKDLERIKTRRLLMFIVLTIAYVAVLGKIPYTLATFLYLIGSYIYFKSTKLYMAVGIAVLVSLGLAYSFGKLFAVRLP